MCGIFGAIKFKGHFGAERFDRFVTLTNLVSYRGPDDHGYARIDLHKSRSFSENEQTEPFDVFLGHRRLSIIDLSTAGKQPLTDGRGRWIVFNGEIFNFVELREELKTLGCEFKTETDTEVILKVYEVFGESGFQKLNGMWAFALADLPAKRIVLSRDRFAIKPLYLLGQGDEYYFASEIKQLIPLLDRKEPNRMVLSAYLAQGLVDYSDQTFFSRITKLDAKCNLVVLPLRGETTKNCYWKYSEISNAKPASVVEEFRELLIDSTRIRLRSDVKVGLLLSGGLDSSSLAVAIREAGNNALETYSVVSDDSRFSEEPFIDAVCRQLGFENIKFRFEVHDLNELLIKALHSNDEPFASLSVVAQYGIFQTIKQESDATVLLSGQGGDEVLLGYLKFFFFHIQELFRKGKLSRALNQLILSTVRRTAVRQFRLSEAKRYMPLMNRGKRSVLRDKAYIPIPVWKGNGTRSRQIADIDSYSVPALTHYEDRNSMAHSLEVRHPFLDHRVVDFALGIPPEMQLSGGWTKNVLRRGFSELPDVIRWRRDKQGFTTPEECWLKNELTEPIESVFRICLLDELGILDRTAFLEMYRSFKNSSPLVSYGDISRPFIAELWAQTQWPKN